jgi:His-Xaa-Ser system protein HxsD
LKHQAKGTLSIRVGFGKYGLDTIRYAAYSVSDAAHVFLKPAAGGVTVELTPKTASPKNNLSGRFSAELKDEKLRAAVFDANRELREFMILKALAYEAAPAAGQEDSSLTPEQEKELDALIAQVESEIKRESAGRKGKDPLGITKTWEEKYGAKTGRQKK